MPLINRTVRDESGAWSLLKKAPVRARFTASSSEGIAVPKFPGSIAGADIPLYTASTRPSRSTTAMTISSDCATVAAACTIIVTSAAVRLCVAGGGGGVTLPEPPPLQLPSRKHKVRITPTRHKSSRTERGIRLPDLAISWLLACMERCAIRTTIANQAQLMLPWRAQSYLRHE